jgi:hypothetical protein
MARGAVQGTGRDVADEVVQVAVAQRDDGPVCGPAGAGDIDLLANASPTKEYAALLGLAAGVAEVDPDDGAWVELEVASRV